MKIKIDYSFDIVFENSAIEHFYALKIIPFDNNVQKIISFNANLNLPRARDGFGNTISFGYEPKLHERFNIQMNAMIEFRGRYFYEDSQTNFNLIYLKNSNYTQTNISFYDYLKTLTLPSSHKKLIEYLVSAIYNDFLYQKGVTTSQCSIEKLLINKAGVCQDFSHLLIAILRNFNIPAKYVAGFIEGEGESHAWVEAYIDGGWIALDPTHNLIVTQEPYVKIAQGIDFEDCALNKGVFKSLSSKQELIVNSIITRE